jgi:hypothetical protein
VFYLFAPLIAKRKIIKVKNLGGGSQNKELRRFEDSGNHLGL